MLDRFVKPRLDPLLDRFGRAAAARGVSADAMTLLGLGLGLAGAGLVVAGHFLPALALILLGRAADGLDGAIARIRGGSPFGAYWDIVADFALYGAVPLAFALHDPASNALPAALLLAAFYLNGASFLGYAVLAERHGLETRARGRKGFYHSGGLLEGTETIAFFAGCCLLPRHFPTLAVLFAALCLLTTILRLLEARRRFGPNGVPPGD